MSVSVHVGKPVNGACAEGHLASLNPRRAGWCVRCGQEIEQPVALKRDRKQECLITRELCTGLLVDVDQLNVFAGRRADQHHTAYGHDFPSLERNLEREALEELADARNYVVWRLDAIHRGLDDDHWRVPHLQLALKFVALAFHEVSQAHA